MGPHPPSDYIHLGTTPTLEPIPTLGPHPPWDHTHLRTPPTLGLYPTCSHTNLHNISHLGRTPTWRSEPFRIRLCQPWDYTHTARKGTYIYPPSVTGINVRSYLAHSRQGQALQSDSNTHTHTHTHTSTAALVDSSSVSHESSGPSLFPSRPPAANNCCLPQEKDKGSASITHP